MGLFFYLYKKPTRIFTNFTHPLKNPNSRGIRFQGVFLIRTTILYAFDAYSKQAFLAF